MEFKDIIQEEIRKIVAEDQKEFFGNKFNLFINLFNKYTSKIKTNDFDDKLFKKSLVARKLANKLFKHLGQGSFRVVYQIDSSWVIKIAYEHMGIENAISSNEDEANLKMLRKYTNIFPRLGPYEKDFVWITQEIAEPIKNINDFLSLIPEFNFIEKMMKISKIDIQRCMNLIFNFYLILFRKQIYKPNEVFNLAKDYVFNGLSRASKIKDLKNGQLKKDSREPSQSEVYDVSMAMTKAFFNNKIVRELAEAVGEFQLGSWDFKLENFGRINDRLVLIDASRLNWQGSSPPKYKSYDLEKGEFSYNNDDRSQFGGKY